MVQVTTAINAVQPLMDAGHRDILAALSQHGIVVDAYPHALPTPLPHHAAAARAYPMQGILKYHGLYDWAQRIAYLPSISLNSDAASTITYVEFDPTAAHDDIWLGDAPAHGRERDRIVQTLDALRQIAGSGCRAAVGGIALWVSHMGLGHAESFAVRLDTPGQFDDVALLTVPIESRIGLKTEQAHADAPASTLFAGWMATRSSDALARF